MTYDSEDFFNEEDQENKGDTHQDWYFFDQLSKQTKPEQEGFPNQKEEPKNERKIEESLNTAEDEN